MRRRLWILALLILACLFVPSARAQPDDPSTLWEKLRPKDYVTECTVNAGAATVDVRMAVAMNFEQAREMCRVVARVVLVVEPGWRVRLFSPYSGDHPIAVCPLKL
jgi:hypothetical protein